MRSNGNNEDVEYDSGLSENMKDMASVLGDMIKSLADAQCFRSALLCPLWYKALVSETREQQASDWEDPA